MSSQGHGQISKLAAITGYAHAEGKFFYVKPAADTGYGDWYRRTRMTYSGGVKNIYNTFEAAYAAVTSNNNDCITLGTHGEHTLADMVTVEKNRFHVMSYDSFLGIHRSGTLQGAKISLPAGVDAVNAIYINGAVRTSWRDIKIMSASAESTAKRCMTFGGEGTYMENCAIQKLALLNATDTYDAVSGEDSGEFINCYFGTDVLLTSAARTVFLIDAVNTPFKSNTLKNCTFVVMSSSADALLLKVADTAAVNFQNKFDECYFLNTICAAAGGAQCTVAAASASGLTAGTIVFTTPHCTAASFSTTSNQFQVTMTPTSTTNAFEVKTPA